MHSIAAARTNPHRLLLAEALLEKRVVQVALVGLGDWLAAHQAPGDDKEGVKDRPHPKTRPGMMREKAAAVLRAPTMLIQANMKPRMYAPPVPMMIWPGL